MNSQAIKFFKDDAKEKLKNIFGFLDYRDGQEEVIDDILNKEDLVVVMPTGSGKSLCYQLPSLVFKNQTIVVSPLISLINDQVDGLNLLGINAKKLHSNLSAEENNLSFKRFQSASEGLQIAIMGGKKGGFIAHFTGQLAKMMNVITDSISPQQTQLEVLQETTQAMDDQFLLLTQGNLSQKAIQRIKVLKKLS